MSCRPSPGSVVVRRDPSGQRPEASQDLSRQHAVRVVQAQRAFGSLTAGVRARLGVPAELRPGPNSRGRVRLAPAPALHLALSFIFVGPELRGTVVAAWTGATSRATKGAS